MTKKHYKAIQWCFANNIYVSPLPKKSGVYIEVRIKNNIIVSPETYHKTIIYKKIWEIYLYLYKKNRKNGVSKNK